jgi:glyceraldehyde-3-phosphate dehydrogenase/erythrose-4-phosphate dehydrogenase
LKKIEQVKEELEEELMPLPNITGVYIGEKDNRKVIKIGVKDINSRELNHVEKNRNGYDIILEETGNFTT